MNTKLKFFTLALVTLATTGCASMATYYAGYEPHSKVEAKLDTFNGNYIINSTQVGLTANMIRDNPSFISALKSPKSDDISIIAMTYLTSDNSFYPTFAEDKEGKKFETRQVWTDLKCDKSTGFYACRWITQVGTVIKWEDVKEKLINPAGVYLFRIHGNGQADTAIHSCQVWEVATELNRLKGITTPVSEYGGQSCYK